MGGVLFVHGLPSIAFLQYIEPKYYHKIIWRTWGHDVNCLSGYLKDIIDNPDAYSLACLRIMKNWPRLLKERRLLGIVKEFRGMGIANVIDEINIKSKFGSIKTYMMPYPFKYDYLNFLLKFKHKKTDAFLHVMIGHSGFSNDDHCTILDALKQYENRKIKLYFILSYGDSDYIKKVKMYIEQCWQGAVEIITEYMSFDRYCDFMNQMDICIFNGTGSYALGNLAMALVGRKTFFLNRKGILKEGFLAEKIPFHYTDEITDMSWENFSKLLEYEIDGNSTLIMKPYEEEVNMWKIILEECR